MWQKKETILENVQNIKLLKCWNVFESEKVWGSYYRKSMNVKVLKSEKLNCQIEKFSEFNIFVFHDSRYQPQP
jgi:hypothetical protein